MTGPALITLLSYNGMEWLRVILDTRMALSLPCITITVFTIRSPGRRSEIVTRES
jgi:hypothetical protein